uniref:Disease resistance protein Roq1-like winged-helix domain-containing protein n=1 Tax=Brassica oleracea TaxID=3712 RepID=A0A3P6FKV1_BRAOL|nr:unnamed protein product [Brassica oleracea]
MTHAPEAYTLGSLNLTPPITKCHPGRLKKTRMLPKGEFKVDVMPIVEGSRIIITTGDMGLLNTCGVENLYEVKCLNDKDALKMFKQIAFQRGEETRTAAPEVWEEALTALESSLDDNITEILRISHEGLPKPHHNVFLHVACLFNGDTLQRINSLLHGPIPQSSLWIRVLAEKSLIKISTNGSVIMHKLAREMIRDNRGSKHLNQLPDLSGITSLEELVLEHCTRLKGIPESIGKKSTLKKLELSYCGGLRRALRFFIRKPTMQQHIGLEFPDAKVKMDAVLNISIGGDISFEFCSKFRGTAEYVSFNCDQQIPVTSSMNLQQAPWLISECNRFNSLSIMRFSHKENDECFSFDSFPDFPDLKELKLVNLNIRKIPSGVHGIHKLEFIEKLDLSGNDFENLPEAMNGLSRLKTPWLRNCFKLKELPELTQVLTLTLTNYQLSHLTKLTNLDLSGHDFDALPSSIRDLTSLITLCLNNCKKLRSVEKLPLSLQFLDAHGCDSLGEADSVEHFRDKPNKEVQQRTFFKETEMPIDVLNHQAIRICHIIHLAKTTPALMFLGIPICIMLVAVLVVLLLLVRVFK